jgi:hypothetical protein
MEDLRLIGVEEEVDDSIYGFWIGVLVNFRCCCWERKMGSL